MSYLMGVCVSMCMYVCIWGMYHVYMGMSVCVSIKIYMHTYILIYILFVNLRKYLIINNNIYHTLFVIEYVNSKLNYIIFINKIFKYYQGFNEFDACLRNFKYINEHLSSRNDVYE